MKPQSVAMNVDTGEKTWLTPLSIIQTLGPFQTDPCCPDGGMPWKTAERMITKSEDGLKQKWDGRVWLNPPYGNDAVPFFKKMSEHGKGTALVFARTDTSMWHDYIFPFASGIFFIRGRLKFYHQDGSRGETATAPSALVTYGEEDLEHLKASILEGKFQGFIVSVEGIAKNLNNKFLF